MVIYIVNLMEYGFFILDKAISAFLLSAREISKGLILPICVMLASFLLLLAMKSMFLDMLVVVSRIFK